MVSDDVGSCRERIGSAANRPLGRVGDRTARVCVRS